MLQGSIRKRRCNITLLRQLLAHRYSVSRSKFGNTFAFSENYESSASDSATSASTEKRNSLGVGVCWVSHVFSIVKLWNQNNCVCAVMTRSEVETVIILHVVIKFSKRRVTIENNKSKSAQELWKSWGKKNKQLFARPGLEVFYNPLRGIIVIITSGKFFRGHCVPL